MLKREHLPIQIKFHNKRSAPQLNRVPSRVDRHQSRTQNPLTSQGSHLSDQAENSPFTHTPKGTHTSMFKSAGLGQS